MGMKNTSRFMASAAKPATAVFDKRRRGNPLPGCDCVQCFGYCFIDGDLRERIIRSNTNHKKEEPGS